jgi:hypothetical protein
VFADRDGNGDLYGDAYLRDRRLRPLPHAAATARVDRYNVVVTPDVVGPIAIVAAVYYQSVEAVAAQKLLGNLADLDTDGVIESCVLGGAWDGRVPSSEPAVVEGAPPVPMTVKTRVVHLRGEHRSRPAPSITQPVTWQFTVAAGAESVTADTRVPLGFPAATPAQPGRVIDRNR